MTTFSPWQSIADLVFQICRDAPITSVHPSCCWSTSSLSFHLSQPYSLFQTSGSSRPSSRMNSKTITVINIKALVCLWGGSVVCSTLFRFWHTKMPFVITVVIMLWWIAITITIQMGVSQILPEHCWSWGQNRTVLFLHFLLFFSWSLAFLVFT